MAELLILIAEMIFLLIVMSVAAELIAIGAEILEHKFGSGFVGSVVLGFITTFPELIFVVIAVLALEYNVALGSAIGGNILLFTLGYGLVILIAYLKHQDMITLPRTIHDDLWYLLISCVYLIAATAIDGQLDLIDGIVLIGIYIIFVIHQFFEARNISFHKLSDEKDPSREHEEKRHLTSKDYAKSAILLIIGSILLLLAAEPFVHSISELSVQIGITALFLALVISPIASELPEKISAYILTAKSLKGAEMAVANFVGSKVQNNSLLFGLMAVVAILINNQPINTGTEVVSLLVMVLTTIVGVIITYDLRLKYKEGIIAVILYVMVITFLYLRPF